MPFQFKTYSVFSLPLTVHCYLRIMGGSDLNQQTNAQYTSLWCLTFSARLGSSHLEYQVISFKLRGVPPTRFKSHSSDLKIKILSQANLGGGCSTTEPGAQYL